MKKILLSLLLVFGVFGTLMAQEEPIPPRRTKAAKMGLFGGFMPGYLFVDTKELNTHLLNSGAAPLGEDGMFMYGGGGAIYIMVVPNLRIGGVGMSGGLTSSKVTAGIRRDAEMRVGYGGVTVEYVVPIVPRLDVSFGTMIGWGGVDVTLTQDMGFAKTWEDEWSDFGFGGGTMVTSVRRQMSGKFWIFTPSVNVEYAILGWLGARLGVSYVTMVSPSWELDQTYDLLNVPSGIKGNGFMINGGLFFGTF